MDLASKKMNIVHIFERGDLKYCFNYKNRPEAPRRSNEVKVVVDDGASLAGKRAGPVAAMLAGSIAKPAFPTVCREVASRRGGNPRTLSNKFGRSPVCYEAR